MRIYKSASIRRIMQSANLRNGTKTHCCAFQSTYIYVEHENNYILLTSKEIHAELHIACQIMRLNLTIACNTHLP